MNNYKKCNLRSGDRVKIITGISRGTIGVIKSFDRKNGLIIIEGVNLKTHFPKSRSGESIIKKEAPIHISNVMILNENNKIVRCDKNKINRSLLLKTTIHANLDKKTNIIENKQSDKEILDDKMIKKIPTKKRTKKNTEVNNE